MFANTIHIGFAQRVVATLVASALVLWSIGAYTTAQAANLTNVSNTLTDSDPNVTSGHSIAFTLPAGSSYTAGNDITIDLSDFGDTTAVGTGDITASVGPTSSNANAVAESGGVLTLDLDESGVAGDEIVVAIDDDILTNPAAGSYEIEVTVDNATNDTGKTRVAIVDNVLVTAIVDTAFQFNITGQNPGASANGTTTTGTTTATTIDFETLTAGEIKTLAQGLDVTTNARNGFVVTVNSDGYLQSSNGAIIDGFTDGDDIATPGTEWTSPDPDVNDETTWGHWGLTTEDADIGSNTGNIYGGADFAANQYIAASTTPREVFAHDGPSDGNTTNIGTTTVAYQVEISALQEAADDYNTTLTYVATPTF